MIVLRNLAGILQLFMIIHIAANENSDENYTTQNMPTEDTTLSADNIPVETLNEKTSTYQLPTITDLSLIPAATVKSQILKANISSLKVPNLKGAIASEECPSFKNAETLSGRELFRRLVHPCRFDQIQRPKPKDESGNILPTGVYVRIYIYYLHEAAEFQFKMQALLQYRYVDPRLVFKEVVPKRTNPIVGENDMWKHLWLPHMFIANEKVSGILGVNEKEILTSISPDGTVVISTRVQATLFCGMDLRKFPFDRQQCKISLESFMYKTSEVSLHWEEKLPVTLSHETHLPEFTLTNMIANETVINADTVDLRHGAFIGNYSSLSFTVVMKRQIGFYVIDYFLPSMMIVGISWVSFWLRADQTAPRVMLGTTTMLTIITLSTSQGKNLPKVSYIKASEIWFMGCTGFIFGTLLEFALVNVIWRRKRNVELKEVNTANILKHTLPRNTSNKDLMEPTITLNKSNNFSNNNTLRVPGFNGNQAEEFSDDKPIQFTASETTNGNNQLSVVIDETLSDSMEDDPSKQASTTMTPKQISNWIDRRSRIVFPCAFVVFNIFYWIFGNT